ncbi:hypothetical protein [Cupriavidus sp. RAF12]|uniref:hypothetical protein n=1 Tax=Cupriavidus sp. RAF12 TaxID=3233050 RepID=UPI003F906F0C
MHNNLLKTLLATATLCACSLAVAQGLQDRGVPGDRYGYEMHNGRRDPFTDGAHGIRKADPYTDGALGTRKSDPFTDGANSVASGMTLAGMDRTGVSAPPAHSA